MILLKEIKITEAVELQKSLYKEKNIDEIQNIILVWENKVVNGKYFEMLGIFNDEELVGIFSLAEQTKNSVSLGIEIFNKFRKLGYGYKALMKGIEKAKEKGYKLTVNQVRIDNIASMALCKKCELETNFYEYINKKGNAVYLYVKCL